MFKIFKKTAGQASQAKDDPSQSKVPPKGKVMVVDDDAVVRKALGLKIEAAGYKEIKPGLYDTRDWDAIRAWAAEMAGRFK